MEYDQCNYCRCSDYPSKMYSRAGRHLAILCDRCVKYLKDGRSLKKWLENREKEVFGREG